MLSHVNIFLDRLKQYSKSLSQTSIFINKPWVMIDEKENQHHYSFQSDGRLIMALNGTVQIGTWEYLLGSNSLLIDRITDKILLNQMFIEDGLMFLKKDGMENSFFILINKLVIPDLDVEKYLKNYFIKAKRLRRFNTDDGKKYYATWSYESSGYGIQSEYQCSFGDEIYTEDLQLITGNTSFQYLDETINTVNGFVKSGFYVKQYADSDFKTLVIKQTNNYMLSIGDSVCDDSGSPVHGIFEFDRLLYDRVKRITVSEGRITNYKYAGLHYSVYLIIIIMIVLIIAIISAIFH